ncbi:hypothetical protein FHR83_007006 [Actinoplanes campanulatus]|uniref:Haemolysin XhlA n=1 Tax=Actinoplanes campanulatus TaxID=113559 RepID=A0A7W5ANB5_9ACTN|nr:hypothetical protein [Actinoplanes campanulatus]MBB3099300.1 hypothetical protein [Actinoplanes campanulatus]GGN40572.1 hypothetical protein GCM10010109_69850 [Actinoplanes campanulatus]GID40618.1 hypothetical protein Aca09nite_71240 [Actinoplanes campanulatus]
MTAPGDHGGVVITLRDIYQQLVGLATRVDTALSRGDHHEEMLTDHESRLRSLERGRWPLASATALIALGSLAVAILVALYKK